MIFRLVALITIGLGIALNLLALKLTVKAIKRYRLAERGQYVERVVRKAKISSKKKSIASQQVKRFRSAVFKTSMLQFLVPFSVFLLALVSSTFIVNYLTYIALGKATTSIAMVGSCIAFVPFEFPLDGACSAYVVWIQFLVFLLFSPWYSYEIRKLVERSKA